jgi:AraC-like DNA-binding protein
VTEERTAGRLSSERWRAEIAPVFAVRPPADGGESEIGGAIIRHHLGAAVVGEVEASAQGYLRSEQLIGAVGVDHLLVQVYRAGRTVLEIDGREIEAGPGDVLFFDLSRPVRSQATAMRAINMVLPRALLDLDADTLDGAHGTVLEGASGAGALAGQHLQSLLATAPALTGPAAGGIVKASAGLLAACLAPALRRERDAPATLTATLATICRFIDREIGNPDLDAALLCAAFGLSRSALYRLFAPVGGVAEYIRRRRLARARLALNTVPPGRGGIGRIARQFGFSSDDAFARAFKARFGVAPREALQLRALPPAQAEEDSLTDWLRRLSW